MKRNGDTIEHFKCKPKTGQLADDNKICYEDIPLKNGYVKVNTRTFTNYSAPRPCDDHYGLKLLTTEGVWVELNPGVRKMVTPEDLPAMDHEFHHEDLSDGGLYTEAELDSWKKHLQLGDQHDAITKVFSFGVCQAEGSCPASADVPTYHLDVLTPRSIAAGFSMWKSLNDYITSIGAYMALLVLVLELARFAVFATTISLALSVDGIEGGKALIYRIFCGAKQEARHVARRRQRLKRRRIDFGDVEEDFVLTDRSPENEGPDL